jgi:hypothetical protein
MNPSIGDPSPLPGDRPCRRIRDRAAVGREDPTETRRVRSSRPGRASRMGPDARWSTAFGRHRGTGTIPRVVRRGAPTAGSGLQRGHRECGSPPPRAPSGAHLSPEPVARIVGVDQVEADFSVLPHARWRQGHSQPKPSRILSNWESCVSWPSLNSKSVGETIFRVASKSPLSGFSCRISITKMGARDPKAFRRSVWTGLHDLDGRALPRSLPEPHPEEIGVPVISRPRCNWTYLPESSPTRCNCSASHYLRAASFYAPGGDAHGETAGFDHP